MLTLEQYNDLHTNFLTPTSLVVDPILLKQQISHFNKWFSVWGDQNVSTGATILPLVNRNGRIDNNLSNDASLWPLERFNFFKYINADFSSNLSDYSEAEFVNFYRSYITGAFTNDNRLRNEFIFSEFTPAFHAITALRVFDEIDSFLLRSDIRKWNQAYQTNPRKENWQPYSWLKLFCPITDNIRIYHETNTNTPTSIYNDFDEANIFYNQISTYDIGRVYIIDTSKWHYFSSLSENGIFLNFTCDSVVYDDLLAMRL